MPIPLLLVKVNLLPIQEGVDEKSPLCCIPRPLPDRRGTCRGARGRFFRPERTSKLKKPGGLVRPTPHADLPRTRGLISGIRAGGRCVVRTARVLGRSVKQALPAGFRAKVRGWLTGLVRAGRPEAVPGLQVRRPPTAAAGQGWRIVVDGEPLNHHRA